VKILVAILALGAIPIGIGLIYLGLQWASESNVTIDPAGIILLLMLGVSMAFGMLVILRGARDL
jgi:hypothetical protein